MRPVTRPRGDEEERRAWEAGQPLLSGLSGLGFSCEGKKGKESALSQLGHQARHTVGVPGNPQHPPKLICCFSETHPGALCYDNK